MFYVSVELQKSCLSYPTEVYSLTTASICKACAITTLSFRAVSSMQAAVPLVDFSPRLRPTSA